MGGTIVCDVTEPPAGRFAAEFAGALGARLDLRLVLVYVLADPPAGAEDSVSARSERSGAQETLDEIAREIGHDADMRLVVGDHAEAVARVAAEEGADLVVVGGRPAGLGRRNLRWTLARQLEAATAVHRPRDIAIVLDFSGSMRYSSDTAYPSSGAYTGSLGYLTREGHLDLNILIRTMTLRGRELSFRAGAGIVADSDPDRELEETRAKARGLLAALEAPL